MKISKVRRWRRELRLALAATCIILPASAFGQSALAQGLDTSASPGSMTMSSSPCVGTEVLLSLATDTKGASVNTVSALLVQSLSFGANEVTSAAGTGAGATRATSTPINLVLRSSRASLALFTDVLTGQPLPGVTINFVSVRGSQPRVCRAMVLVGARVTSYQESITSGGPGATDAVTFSYTAVKISEAGQAAASPVVSWNTITNQQTDTPNPAS